MPTPRADADAAGGASGRRFVIVAVLGMLVLWGALSLTFRHWREGYRRRQAFGAQQVAAAIDPLAAVVPEGDDIPPDAWRRAVAETHAMLVTLTAANVLGQAQLEALRVEVRALVARARARPGTARAELARLWDDLEARAGPIIQARHRRPAILPPSRAREGRN